MTVIEEQARVLFLAALEQTPEEWPVFLEESSGGNAELRARVEELLRAHQAMGRVHGGDSAAPAASIDSRLAERPGTMIGSYKLLEQIGEGGFGVVYMAEQQQPVRRKVALKVIKPGMDTKQVIARFEAERQALAWMDHPHIARVLDAGATDTGRPYFVMELIRGIPITAFCDANRLTPRERLELFHTVCLAVQHAHQKGIIHRDLKPSNVLVTLHDGKPLIKIIDFGIAKALGQERLTEKTLFTGFAQMLGTPLYMSPEQAEMSSQDVDTRTDIYALGVLLYELLTGTTPFDKERLKDAGYDEIRRIIREEEPAKPSTRISTLGQAATTVSAQRKSEPRRLSQLFRGELDWLVMKALEKDRNRRYESASGFAADVQRFLKDEPVQACPPSAMYRFRKFARRNKGALITATAVACAVLLAVAGLAASTVLTLQAKEELQQNLERERQNAYFQRIALAEREWSANNVRGWEELLASCSRDLRGWEWHYLSRLGHNPIAPLHHGGAVFGLAVHPNGGQVASCSQDGTIKIWDAKTGRELRPIVAHGSHARSVAFSPDGRFLASASWDGTVKIWSAQTGQELHRLLGHQGEVWSVAFSPGGKLLASGGGKSGQVGEVKLWNAATGQVVRTLVGHTSSVYSVAFSPDGKHLASGGSDGMVKLWDIAAGREQWSLAGPGNHYQVFGVAFSPDGRFLATCGGWRIGWGNGRLKICRAETGQELFDLSAGHTRGVWCVAFSPDGRRLASGSVDQTVKLWDVASGQEALTLRGHLAPVRSVVFSPDGHRLFSCGHDESIRVWDATPLQPGTTDGCLTLRGHSDEVTSVAFSPRDPAVMASASVDGTIMLWNARTGKPMLGLRDPKGAVYGLGFSPDAALLATVGQEKNVKIWDTTNGKRIATLPPDGNSGLLVDGDLSVAFLPGGKKLASAGWGKVVRIWDVQAGKLIRTLSGHNWAVNSVACSPDGKLVASAGGNGTVRLWDAESGQPVPGPPLQNHAMVMCVAFSCDGKQLAAACWNRSVNVWDTKTWKLLHSLRDETGGPRSLAFSPDGRRIAWGGTDSTVKLWEAATGEIHVFRGHTNWVHGVAFGPDGKQIASASADGTVKVWTVPPLPQSQGATPVGGLK